MKREVTHILNLRPQGFSGPRFAVVPVALLAMWTMTGAFPGLAQQPPQPTFPSAEEATKSLFQAVQSNDEETIVKILGGPTELTSSRDKGQDKVDRELFVQKYQEMHRLGREPDGCVTLYIGAENWPFPITIIEKNNAWRFDPDAGVKEVMFRRIGENELTAIALCHEYAAAAKQDRTHSNLTSVVSRVAGESAGGDPILFHGYYFRELPIRPKTAGGFALIAYPTEYRSSGVMTFIIKDNDVVYEKDLGAKTSALAPTMATFHKDATWRSTDE
ncbi:MAG: hypothetical protein JWP63_1927 [Candidatus Solibacter sp.]|nr:hypothetical protein [Candidatus Solibacter sp.]